MQKNIYTSLSGALAQERVLEIIANNLANAQTNGFKEEEVTFKLLPPEPERTYNDPLPPANYKIPFEELMPLRGNDFSYVGVSGVTRNDQQGPAIETKNPLNLMLDGQGFFSVHTKEGVRYTRDGAFSLNANGLLTDWSGNPILGEKGNIFLNDGPVEVNSIGEIYQNGEFIDKILVYQFAAKNQLEKVGSNHFFYKGRAEEIEIIKTPGVKQGYLEGSNVNAIKNLTNMILAHRSYEAYQKALTNMDKMMDISSNSIAQVVG